MTTIAREQYLTREQAAERWRHIGVTAATIRELQRTKKLPAYGGAKRALVLVEELDELFTRPRGK